MAATQTVAIERVTHIGIRVRDLDRALAFYGVLGFALSHRAQGDDVAIIRNPQGVEINLIFNANAGDPATNILMDVAEKYPGYTHVALYVASIPATITALKANDIAITQGPVKFGEDGGVVRHGRANGYDQSVPADGGVVFPFRLQQFIGDVQRQVERHLVSRTVARIRRLRGLDDVGASGQKTGHDHRGYRSDGMESEVSHRLES